MKIIPQHRAPVGIAAIVALVAITAMGWTATVAQAVPGPLVSEWLWSPATDVVEAVPPLPPTGTFPVQLVLDDDSSDGAVGVAGQTARQFLWFNRFSAGVGFHLEEVWVLFPSGANMAAGAAIQIAIYEDPDGDPANGANLIASFNDTIQAADDNTFSLYTVPGALVIPAGSDLLVGVVPRFIASGVTPPTLPAALDTTASQSRSWLAAWTTDPPDPPLLVPLPDQTLTLVDGFFPGGGNFMIRAFGTSLGVAEIPALDRFGAAALALGLLGAGTLVLRRRKAAAAIVLLFLALAGPAGAVTIDTFTTNQAVLSDPPGGNSSALGGADIIGTRRGMVVDNLLGAGPTTSSVAAGNLALLVTATTPDSRGEARLSWDGDALPLVLNPTGLANANLTTGNASGFRLDFVSTTVVAEIEITVYEDAANFSRVARRVPVGGAQSVSIPFAEFRIAGGTGADFASVGAIEMTVRSDEGSVTLSEVTTTAPTIAATKVDAQIVDTDGDTRVDPGDRVRYTVTVTNTGNQALAVNLTDTVDANTTLVAGSVSSTPVAHNDQYGWFGNVTFSADGSPFPMLLANDADADGDDVDVQAGTFPATTAEGGSVTLVDAETGEFTYAPPAGFKGIDSFLYTIEDGDAHTATATAYIHLEGIVWFVDNGCTVGCGQGTLTSPFTTLPAAETPSGENDIIYIRTGIADYDTGGANGFTMDPDQQLLGEGRALILGGTTIVPQGVPPTLTNNDGTPGRGVTLASTGGGTDTLRGLGISHTGGAKIFGNGFGTLAATSLSVFLNGNGQALDLTNGVLAADFASISTGSSTGTGLTLIQVSGTLTSTGTTVSAPTTQGILVNQSTVNANFGDTAVIGTGTDRISLQNNSGGTRTFSSITTSGGTGVGFLHAVGGGTTTVTGATSITNPGGIGISIASSTSAVTFASTTINKGATAGTGLSLAGNSGTTTFSNLAVTTSNGTGILASTSPLSVGGTGSTVVAAGGPALDLTTVNLGAGATFATASSTGSPGKGMNLDALTGALTMNGGSISGPAGIAFDLSSGSSNVTYAGSISNTANQLLVDITARTGGTVNLSGALSASGNSDGINVANNNVSGSPVINFSNASKVLSTGTHAAVSLDNNDVATINFTGGGLDIDTTSGTGFNAINGAAAISVQGSGNSITSTTGPALNLASSAIGGSGLTFQSISANGATNGIVLNTTGGLGGLTVTGTGATDGSGGTIQNTSGRGAAFISTAAISLSNMNFTNAGTSDLDADNSGLSTGDNLATNAAIHLQTVTGASLANLNITGGAEQGINGNAVSNFSLSNSSIVDVGNGPDEDGIHFFNMSGTSSITNTTLACTVATHNTTGGDDHINLQMQSGTLNLTISGGSATNANKGSGYLMGIRGTANATVTVDGVTSDNNFSGGIVIDTFDTATSVIEIMNSSSINNNDAISLSSNNGNTRFDIHDNVSFAGTDFGRINILKAAFSTMGTLEGKIRNNPIVVTDGQTADGIFVFQAGDGTLTVSITNNTFTYRGTQRPINIQGGQDGSGQLNATVTGNSIDMQLDGTGNAVTGIFAQTAVASPSGDNTNMCADIGGAGALRNIFTHSMGGNMAAGEIRVRQRFVTTVTLPGYGGASGDNAAVVAYLAGRNTLVNVPTATATNEFPATVGAGGFVGAASCPQPNFP